MAIWITRVLVGNAGLRLRVEGQIVGDWCGMLEQECQASRRQRREVALDLSGVSFVDRRGLETLRRLRSCGLILVDVPPLVAESVDEG